MGFKKESYTVNVQSESKNEFKKAQNDRDLTLREKGNTIDAKQIYHNQGLHQAKVGFYVGIVGAFIGLVVIIFTLLFMEEKSWGTISGIITEGISFLIFKISDKAIDRMETFFDRLGEDSNKIKAIDLAKGIKNEEVKDELSVKLALFLAGINEDKICQYTKEVCKKEQKVDAGS